MELEPLEEDDALNLALEMSPKILETVRNNSKERAFCRRLAQSLEGNPLALKLVFSALEPSLTQPLSELILSIWTKGFPGQIYEHSPGLKRHVDYFLSQLEDGPSKMMTMLLSPFKNCVPRDLSKYFGRLTALGILTECLPGSMESSTLDGAESSQKHKLFDEMMNSVVVKLEGAGLVTNTRQQDQWILHPLLPYILSPKSANFSTINMERVMNAHADVYMARAKEWKNESPIPREDMRQEYLNFISSFWRLSNPEGISVGTPAPWYLRNLLGVYDVSDERGDPDMVIAIALCEEILCRFQNSSGDWERSLSANLIYRPSGEFLEAKMKEDEHKKHNCPCKPLIALMAIGLQVQTYHASKMAGEMALRVHTKRLVDLWKLHEKHFDDDFHYQINCGPGGHTLMHAGIGYFTTFCLQEALKFLTRAQKLLEDCLVTYPTFKDPLEMCKIYIARTEMLLANHGSRDSAVLNLRQDEMTQALDKIWKSGPDFGQVKPWHDLEMRQAREDSSIDIESVLAKDISEPGSQEKAFKTVRQAQLDNLETEMNILWIPGQIQSKRLMALAASRLHDWKQAQRLNEDILILLDQVEFGSEMERSMKKFEQHIFAAQSAISGAAYEAAVQHLQKGYDIMHSYRFAHDTRYGMFKVLNMANSLPKDVSYQLGGLSPVVQDVQLLILLYDPTILESEDFRKLSKNIQDKVRLDVFSTNGMMRGNLFAALWRNYFWDSTQGRFKSDFPVTGTEIMNATGANRVDFGQLIFVDIFRAVGRVPAEVPNVADRGRAFLAAYREAERALFAPPELRKDFRWLDKKYEEHVSIFFNCFQ